MTDYFKRNGQTDEKSRRRYVMLRQEMESYPIIFETFVHKKDDNKLSKDI